MITEKLNIRMDSVFSDDKKHRFLLRKTWGKTGKIATIIMINPNISECLITGMTENNVYNGIARFGDFAAVNIVNLYSLITPKITFRWNNDEDLYTSENDIEILKAVRDSDQTILAWGTIADNNNRVKKRVLDVMTMLADYKDKLYFIRYGEKEGLHPLCPQLRSSLWELSKVNYDELIKELENALKTGTKE